MNQREAGLLAESSGPCGGQPRCGGPRPVFCAWPWQASTDTKHAVSPPNEQASSWISILMGWEYPPRAATGVRRNSKRDVLADSKRKACTPEHTLGSASPWGGKEEKRSKEKPTHPKPPKAKSHHACNKRDPCVQYASRRARSNGGIR